MTISQGLGGPNLADESRLGMDSRLIFLPTAQIFFKETKICSLCGLLDFRLYSEDFSNGIEGSLLSGG